MAGLGIPGIERRGLILVYLIALVGVCCPLPVHSEDAQALIEAAVAYYRGKASVAEVEMTIHRPAWTRTMTIKAWTKGLKYSLFTVVAPPKDEGNSTLKRGTEMWTFNPKVNRVIKLPPSLMSQSWMGSDFSNNDLAKSDAILEDYVHTLMGTETHEGMKVFIIKSLPKPRAPVIWGMQILKIREDHILLSEAFYDEDLKLVKAMTGTRIQMLGGKLFPKVWKMERPDTPDEYTLLDYETLDFMDDLPERYFTLTALRDPGR
jgi:outer membrane lipoprotein-sorting protein